jgi:uncharacterized protein (TIGR00661 family)
MAKKIKKKIIFLINGLGLGNSSRCDTLIKILKKKFEIYLVLSGNSRWYFRKKLIYTRIYISSIKYYKNNKKKLDIFLTLIKLLKSFYKIKKNNQKILRFIKKINPDKIISDSVYFNTLKIDKKIEKICLNNSENTVKKIICKFFWKRNILAHFFFIELIDYLICIIFYDKILSPVINNNDIRYNKNNLIRVPIISRFKYNINRNPNPNQNNVITIMLSGSSFSENLLLDKTLSEFRIINIVGGNIKINFKNLDNIKIIGKNINIYKFLKNSDFLIINSGYSAICDALKLCKPMILLPIENHAEQWANAKQIEVMGLGKIVNKKYLSDEILNMKKSLNKYNENYKKIKKENIDDYLKKLF